MTLVERRTRPSAASRRVGYVVSAAVNAVLLYLVNVRPGWEAVPFLTPATVLVLPLVNASMVVSLAANLVYALYDPAWLKALGDLATTAVGLAALVKIWQVFPLAFTDTTLPWETVARVLLAVGIVGSAIGILVAAVALIRGLARLGR